MRVSPWCIALLTLSFKVFGTCIRAFTPRVDTPYFPQRSIRTGNLQVSKTIHDDSQTLSSFYPVFSSSLEKLGFSSPTPIQRASAETLSDPSSSDNLLLIAPTGSGKTLSYLLPALSKAKSTNGGTVLMVAPTRELAVQLLRDAADLISNQEGGDTAGIVLAVLGVDLPTPNQLNTGTLLIGTPPELLQVLSSIQGGTDFIAGDVLSTIILDEVDVLLPNPPKILRTSLDNGNRNDKNGKKSNTPQDERRRQEQKRKLMAVKRQGIELSNAQQVVSPTENILRLVATRRFAGGDESSPFQIIAGSATASRKTLDRLNRALRDAAGGAASTYQEVWNGDIKACRPIESLLEDNSPEKEDLQHTIRAVTVPQEVKHQFIAMDKESASSPDNALAAVAKATEKMKPESALVFICGEFGKSNVKEKQAPKPSVNGATSKARRTKSFKQKLMAKKAAKKGEAVPVNGVLSARRACKVLSQHGIKAQPLHVALGLELHAEEDDEEAETPPFLVTFEGSARGLHFEGVDVVFVVGRPSSAASYLHLAGRVGRSYTTESGEVAIRPGTVVSLCTTGSAKELTKWTKQIGGTDLEELVL